VLSISDRLRGLLGSAGSLPPLAASPSILQNRTVPARFQPEVVTTRQSRGLEQFFGYIRDQVGLSILDFGGANQANVSCITSLGHRVYAEDFLRSLDDILREQEPADQAQIDYFLRQNLDFPDETFDGVLVWDVLQYMPPALLTATLDKLYRIVKPKSYLLAYFHSDEKAQQVPVYSFRIKDQQSLILSERGRRKPAQLFNNRSLEKLFHKFESVKFFLTREQLREVIVKR
jgi:2-polyprenyl-3-methyl-5-hydroxy-6-metoxy-1,4-benzoquinol methylase